MPFLLCEMTVCHIDHREKAYLSNPAQMSLPQPGWSLLLWNCHALVTCHPGATPGPSIPTHFPLHPNTVVQPCQLSTNTNKHQGSVSLMMILPANIVCHRIYSQQVSVMITSEHASRSSRGKGARRQCVSPVTTESLSHGVNPALEIHCYEDIVLPVLRHPQAFPLAEHLGSRTPMLQKHPRKHRILENKDMCPLWDAVDLHKMKTFVTQQA